MDYRSLWKACQKRISQSQRAIAADYRKMKAGQFSKRQLALLFLLGVLLGAGAKVVAARTVTIGYEDYRIITRPNLVNLNTLPLIPRANGEPHQGPQCKE